jgi:hypothetical protein
VKIAIIAWGPLVSRPETLSFIGRFKPTDLRLPIEFCRLSEEGRLTPVIDRVYGALCATRAALSGFEDMPYAINNLRKRERTIRENIGFVDMRSGQHSPRTLNGGIDTVEAIKAWLAAASGYDAAVWTGLARNLPEAHLADQAFSVEATMRHLETLDAHTLEYVLAYVWEAPAEMQTPVRAAIEARWPQHLPIA